MPAAWSNKDERMYAAIKKSCNARGDRTTKTCTRIAAATVNQQRRREGRTLSGLGSDPTVFNPFGLRPETRILLAVGVSGLVILTALAELK
jgi:hypothetical protein